MSVLLFTSVECWIEEGEFEVGVEESMPIINFLISASSYNKKYKV